MQYRINFDGSYSFNTGMLTYSWVLAFRRAVPDIPQVIAEHVGQVSDSGLSDRVRCYSMVAEWLGCISARAEMQHFDFPVPPTRIILVGDCKSLIDPLRSRRYWANMNPTLFKLCRVAFVLAERLGYPVEPSHVPRKENAHADSLIRKFLYG